MRLKPVLMELICLALLVPVVVLLFRVIPDRIAAATTAGTLFVLVPLVFMVRRWRQPLKSRSSNRLWWVGVLQFWILFALPILGMRLMFWGTPFEEFTFFGVSGPEWHRLSSRSYLLMTAAIALAGWLSPKIRKAGS
ncbi:MAG: hypothetical protein KF865_10995 [Bdellovibrionaceae bacterium]|nr:hypothetical protein [Pseudobdellovibrionaceae bacterium]